MDNKTTILRMSKLYWENVGHSYTSNNGRFKIYETWLNNVVGYKLIDYDRNEFVSKSTLRECMEEAEARNYIEEQVGGVQ